MSKVGAIDPNSILWHPIVVTKCPDHTMFDYEKSLIRSEVKFDKLRCCELENMIHVWKNEKSLSKTRNLEEFKQFFIKNFKVFEVVYDFSKFYIYKFKMQASKEGKSWP